MFVTPSYTPPRLQCRKQSKSVVNKDLSDSNHASRQIYKTRFADGQRIPPSSSLARQGSPHYRPCPARRSARFVWKPRRFRNSSLSLWLAVRGPLNVGHPIINGTAGHGFCTHCLTQARTRDNKCPTCRAPSGKKTSYKATLLQSYCRYLLLQVLQRETGIEVMRGGWTMLAP